MPEINPAMVPYFLAGCDKAVKDLEDSMRIAGYADVAVCSLLQRAKEYEALPFAPANKDYRSYILAGYYCMLNAFGEGILENFCADTVLADMRIRQQKYHRDLSAVAPTAPPAT